MKLHNCQARSQRPLPGLVFRADRKIKIAALAFAETCLTSPLKLLSWNQRNLTERKITTSPTNVVVFLCRSQKKITANLWLAVTFSLLLWNCLTEFNENWQENTSQCPLLASVLFSSRSEKQDGRPACDWLRHIRLSPLWLLKRIQWDLTGSKISLSSIKFVSFGLIGKTGGRPGLWLVETLSTSPMKPLNGIQSNFTVSKISTSPTKFVFVGPTSKQKWSRFSISKKYGTLYSGARYWALWVSCWNHLSHSFHW